MLLARRPWGAWRRYEGMRRSARPTCPWSAGLASGRGVGAAAATAAFASTAGASGSFRCAECGQAFAKWQGQCSACSAWGSVEAARVHAPMYRQANAEAFSKARKAAHGVSWAKRSGDAFDGGHDEPRALRMADVEVDAVAERLELPERELVRRFLRVGTSRRAVLSVSRVWTGLWSWQNWVLGGGLVAGSLTLVAGNPGVGKSTVGFASPSAIHQQRSSRRVSRRSLPCRSPTCWREDRGTEALERLAACCTCPGRRVCCRSRCAASDSAR